VKNCSVSELIQNHWKQYGRNYYSRHDYEAIPSTIANQIFNNLSSMLPSLKNNKFAGNLVKQADNFSYLDPVDNSISKNQGLRIILEDNSRVIIRLSGTGTKGSTLRLYFEKFANSQHNLDLNPQIALKDLINDLDHLLNISKLTKMEKPTVIT
jgi:phosphoglucomutase